MAKRAGRRGLRARDDGTAERERPGVVRHADAIDTRLAAEAGSGTGARAGVDAAS
jgi:hypothetical protein